MSSAVWHPQISAFEEIREIKIELIRNFFLNLYSSAKYCAKFCGRVWSGTRLVGYSTVRVAWCLPILSPSSDSYAPTANMFSRPFHRRALGGKAIRMSLLWNIRHRKSETCAQNGLAFGPPKVCGEKNNVKRGTGAIDCCTCIFELFF